MLRYFVIAIMFGSALAAQESDLVSQIKLIHRIMPDAARISLVYSQGANLDNVIRKITEETGLRIVRAPVSDIRDLNKILRNLERFHVELIFMMEGGMVTSINSIRTTTKFGSRNKIPVFTTAEAALAAGSLGQPYLDGAQWRLRLNSKVLSGYDLQIPKDDSRYVIVD